MMPGYLSKPGRVIYKPAAAMITTIFTSRKCASLSTL